MPCLLQLQKMREKVKKAEQPGEWSELTLMIKYFTDKEKLVCKLCGAKGHTISNCPAGKLMRAACKGDSLRAKVCGRVTGLLRRNAR